MTLHWSKRIKHLHGAWAQEDKSRRNAVRGQAKQPCRRGAICLHLRTVEFDARGESFLVAGRKLVRLEIDYVRLNWRVAILDNEEPVDAAAEQGVALADRER